MTPSEFWQNFKLGQEQEIASNFIYDGLRNLHEMETLAYETEIFPVLYNLSIGLERLFKVAIVLTEFKDGMDSRKFEKSLKTHNHVDLLGRLEKTAVLNLDQIYIDFLDLLSTFYKKQRYDRFSLYWLTVLSKDKKILYEFLNKNLKIDIEEESFIPVENSIKIKEFIGKIIKKITKELYSVIEKAAHIKNLSTEEISSSSSKAGKVLLGEDSIIFEAEDIAILEILIFLMNTKESSRFNFIRDLKPLPLDPALDSEYLKALLYKRPREMQSIIDEIEAHYEEIDSLKDRIEIIKAIKNPNIEI